MDGVIRFGLGAVAKAGHTAVEAILAARNAAGPFKSLWDFLCRVDLRVVNKSVIENLISAGAFDTLCPNRRSLMEGLPDLLSAAQKKCSDGNQCSLFEMMTDPENDTGPDLPDVEDYTQQERLEHEMEATGLYISGHPFEEHEKRIQALTSCSISDLGRWSCKNRAPLFGGMVLSITDRMTKNGNAMGIVKIEDGKSRVEVVCFPKIWETLRGRIGPGTVCLVQGLPEEREELSVIAKEIYLPEDIERGRLAPFVRVSLFADSMKDRPFKELLRALKTYPGKASVLLELKDDTDSVVLMLDNVRVNPDAPIESALGELLPESAFQIQ